MYFVYRLQSVDFPNQIYTGITSDIDSRLSVHNSGGSVYTAAYKPWLLTFYIAFATKAKAVSFERYLKSGSGRAFATKHF